LATSVFIVVLAFVYWEIRKEPPYTIYYRWSLEVLVMDVVFSAALSDYIALFKTRKILQLLSVSHNVLIVVPAVLSDIILSIFISVVVLTSYLLIYYNFLYSLHEGP
jgi:hypothetical protein